jgi:hypothetical protein
VARSPVRPGENEGGGKSQHGEDRRRQVCAATGSPGTRSPPTAAPYRRSRTPAVPARPPKAPRRVGRPATPDGDGHDPGATGRLPGGARRPDQRCPPVSGD